MSRCDCCGAPAKGSKCDYCGVLTPKPLTEEEREELRLYRIASSRKPRLGERMQYVNYGSTLSTPYTEVDEL